MDRLVFMGTPRFGQMILEALIGRYEVAAVITQPDRKAGRGRRISVSAVKGLAQAHGLPILQPQRIREPEVMQRLRDLAPSVMVVAAYGQILPLSILSLPQHGSLNVHASLLPRHRGGAPIPAAILAGDKQTGVTVMLMDEGLDTGSILSQAAVDIHPEDTSASLTEKLGPLGGQLLLDTLPQWIAGEITPRRQDESLATYARLLHREDGRIDWAEGAEKIARSVRAYAPWPGTYSFWRGKKVKLMRTHAWQGEMSDRPPGSVVQLDSQLAVVTGQGLLIIEELQLAGRRRLPAEQFVCGQRDFVGSILQ
jgi:methionyl-tRNA formyltransferase